MRKYLSIDWINVDKLPSYVLVQSKELVRCNPQRGGMPCGVGACTLHIHTCILTPLTLHLNDLYITHTHTCILTALTLHLNGLYITHTYTCILTALTLHLNDLYITHTHTCILTPLTLHLNGLYIIHRHLYSYSSYLAFKRLVHYTYTPVFLQLLPCI